MFATVIRGHCLGGGKDVYEGAVLDLTPQVFQVKAAQGFVRESTPDEVSAFVADRAKARQRVAAIDEAAEDDAPDAGAKGKKK